MKKTLLFIASLLIAMSGFASEKEVFNHTAYCGEEGTNMRTYTTPHFKMVQQKGPGKGDSWFNDEYDDLRLYKNQTMTITALEGVAKIDAVIFNTTNVKTSTEVAVNSTYSNGVTAEATAEDCCKLTVPDGVLSFVITASEGQLRMTFIEFHFTAESGAQETITVNPATLDFGNVEEGEQKVKEVNITGTKLSEAIQYSVTKADDAFSFSGELGMSGGKLTVTLSSEATVGAHSAEVKFVSGSASATLNVTANIVAKGGPADADGSKEHPYSVSDIMKGSISGSVWVIGYIWGQPASGTSLKSEPDADTAIALGDAPESDGSAFMPAQLKDNDIRATLGLASNPSHIGRRVKIFGKVDTYFSVNAIKPVSDYEFVDDGPQEQIYVESVSLSDVAIELEEGESYTLTATIAPATATDKSVSWSTSDDKVAMVSNGKVKAIAEGTAVITVTTTDGGFTASCSVKVNKKADAVEDVNGKQSATCRKVVREGVLYIEMPDGTTYTATGARK